MKKYSYYRTIVFTVTTALVFYLWVQLQPTLSALSGLNKIVSALIGAIVSLGAYRLVVTVFESLLIKIPIIKKLILGNSYLEGIWVGAYIGYSGEPRLIIEQFEQDFDRLIIRGKAFYLDKSLKGSWVSNDVSIDSEKGRISYTYNSTMMKDGYINCGFAEFFFDRRKKSSIPYKIYGFSNDFSGAFMSSSIEMKIKGNAKKFDTEEKLLDEAIRVYTENKDRLKTEKVDIKKMD